MGSVGHLLLGLSAWHLNPFLYSGNLLLYESGWGSITTSSYCSYNSRQWLSQPPLQLGSGLWPRDAPVPDFDSKKGLEALFHAVGVATAPTKPSSWCRSGNSLNCSNWDLVAAAAAAVASSYQCCGVIPVIPGKPCILTSSFQMILRASDLFNTLFFGLIGPNQLQNSSLCWTSFCARLFQVYYQFLSKQPQGRNYYCPLFPMKKQGQSCFLPGHIVSKGLSWDLRAI